jgi:hypothetical protein
MNPPYENSEEFERQNSPLYIRTLVGGTLGAIVAFTLTYMWISCKNYFYPPVGLGLLCICGTGLVIGAVLGTFSKNWTKPK